MSRKLFYWDQDLAASDFFCGAGGLGWGVEQAGATLALAVNHDARSIATYKRNFPFADVRCSWMEDINWTEAPDTLLGVGSPECRYNSPGAGEKLNDQMKCPFPGWTDYDTSPEVEKSRASMWQVYRAAEAKAKNNRPFHSLIFENVVEVEKWRDYGEWKKKMLALGYEHQILYLNAMHFGVAQSRDRWIAVFWREGAKRPDLDYRPTAPCVHCGRDVQAVQCWKKATKKRGKNEAEIKGGSGLPAGYEIVADGKDEVVRQCGHMVPTPLAQWVTQQVIKPLQEVSA
jgi:DNA (cytosine-5)-methyltransferase 1